MRIRLAFKQYHESELDMPTLLVAVDEYIEDAWGGRIPDFYNEAIAHDTDTGEIREMFVTIPDNAVLDLFSIPTVKGEIGDH